MILVQSVQLYIGLFLQSGAGLVKINAGALKLNIYNVGYYSLDRSSVILSMKNNDLVLKWNRKKGKRHQHETGLAKRKNNGAVMSWGEMNMTSQYSLLTSSLAVQTGVELMNLLTYSKLAGC